MKSLKLLAVTLVVPFIVGACNRDERMDILLSSAVYEQQEVAAVSLDQLVEMAPTAAGMVPVWMSLSQSERLSDAVIERSMPGEESAFVNE